jgi:hypothetical protein
MTMKHPVPFTPRRRGKAATLRRAVALAGVLFATLVPAAASAAPDPSAWHARYAHARTLLVDGHAEEAATVFESLASDAPTDHDAELARELASVARSSANKQSGPKSPHVRTSDELSVLYASAFIYGLGTGGWVVLLTQPGNFAAAILPFAGITTAAVGGVAVVDGYKPFRRGVPHSIAAGLYLGLGEGVWVVGLQHAGAMRRDDDSRWGSSAVATALWAGATLGGVTGGVIGSWREPTPGRVSFTSSAGTWAGLTSGFLGAAFESRDRSRPETAFLVGGIGYNLGIIGGVAFAPAIAPSVTRVRFIDLGALSGGLVGAGSYAIAAEGNASVRVGLGFAAAGMATGSGIAWWLTSGMPQDPPSRPAPAVTIRPLVTPTPGGLILGVSGAL